MISEEEFKSQVRRNLVSGTYGCMRIQCSICPVDHAACAGLPGDLLYNHPAPNDALFQAYLDGKVVIFNREWCVVEED